MKTMIQLESKDVRVMIADFLHVRLEDVIPNRYNFSIQNVSMEEVEKKIKAAEDKIG